MATVDVSESEAAFLDEAAATISKMAQEVAAIPPKSFLDFGSAWGAQFGRFYDTLTDLMDRARLSLAPNSEARAQFTAAANAFNKALGVAQNAEEGWSDAIQRFARNPLAFQWRAAKSIASAEVEGAVGIGEDAVAAAARAAKQGIADAVGSVPWGKVALAALVLGAVLVGTRR